VQVTAIDAESADALNVAVETHGGCGGGFHSSSQRRGSGRALSAIANNPPYIASADPHLPR
jgi:methylase of polypeptide subunit release factors